MTTPAAVEYKLAIVHVRSPILLLMGERERERDRQKDSETEIVMHREREEMMKEIETADPERSLCHSHSSEHV